MPIVDTPFYRSVHFFKGIMFVLIFHGKRTKSVKPDLCTIESRTNIIDERFKLSFLKIHDHSLDNENKATVWMLCLDFIHPCRFKH